MFSLLSKLIQFNRLDPRFGRKWITGWTEKILKKNKGRSLKRERFKAKKKKLRTSIWVNNSFEGS